MIVYKQWRQKNHPSSQQYARDMDGWFLFGFIPLSIRDQAPRGVFGT